MLAAIVFRPDEIEWYVEWPRDEPGTRKWARLVPEVAKCPALVGYRPTTERRDATDGGTYRETVWKKAGAPTVTFEYRFGDVELGVTRPR